MPAEARSFRPLPQKPFVDPVAPLLVCSDVWLSVETPVTRTAELADLFTAALFARMVPLPRRKPAPSPWALRAINLTIYPGEVIAITGPSDAENTALLTLVSGARTPTRGSIQTPGKISPIFPAVDPSVVVQADHFEVLLFDLCNTTCSATPVEWREAIAAPHRAIVIASAPQAVSVAGITRAISLLDGQIIADVKQDFAIR